MVKISKSGNFSYLKGLIESFDEISLDRDITIDDSEVKIFAEGIEITKDILIIDGNNHVIDAEGKSSIFTISSAKIILKNIIFKNGHGIELGGALNHTRGKIDIIHCKFINNSCDDKGGAIAFSFRSDAKIIDCKFIKNYAEESGCIFNKNGIVKLLKCEFVENSSPLLNMMMGMLTVKDSVFSKNFSKNSGALLNFGKAKITNTVFDNNSAEDNGGAINNQPRASLEINESRFIENTAGNNGGAILNFSRTFIYKTLFLKNHSKNQAGAISNQRAGSLTVNDSEFIENVSDMTSGAILNWGEIGIADSIFKNNRTVEFGGAMLNGETGVLKIRNSEFINNISNHLGGAVANWSEIHLKFSKFTGNVSKYGGAVSCTKKAWTRFEKTEFDDNSAEDGAAIFNNSYNTRISYCIFKNHNGVNVVRNYKSVTLFECNFNNNNVENSIINDDNAFLSIIGGEFTDISKNATIYHAGDFSSITKSKFKSDGNDLEIFNETYMIINDLEFEGDDKKLVNVESLDVKNTSDEFIEKYIVNRGQINNFSMKTSNKYDFSHLQKKIDRKRKFKRPNLRLKHDISLELYESDYFEGGIEIKADNLTIDGENHTIDGKHRSRIFLISSKNVTLKNMILKNGMFRNDHDEYVLGGGAIYVPKGSSLNLENVKFINNKSNTCAGAILNGGVVKSVNSRFINNASDSYGGAIYNKNIFNTKNDEFKKNRSKIAGAIYNHSCMKIEEDILMHDNESQLSGQIYNANVIDSENAFDDLIFDTANLAKSKSDSKSFVYLEEEIEKSDEIRLNGDIVFDYGEDYYLRYIIQISKDLVIDGCGHTIEFNPLESKAQVIDGNNSSSLFKIIKKSTNVTLKNIVFRNCYSNRQSIIENKGNLTIENCKFINNRITESNSLIENGHVLRMLDCDFANNNANRQSLIKNSSELEIIRCDFINNKSQAIGTCITNGKDMVIEKSSFNNNITKNKAGAIHNEYKGSLKISDVNFQFNSADVEGGAIYNYGNVDIISSDFLNNTSQDDGGVINNRTSGEIKIRNSKFIENESKSNGGVIYNYGDIDIGSCKFISNSAKYRASVIEHQRALDNRKNNTLTISKTTFAENDSKEIFAFDDANLRIDKCSFDRQNKK